MLFLFDKPRGTYGSLGTGVGVPDGDPLAAVAAAIVATQIEGADVVIVAARQLVSSRREEERGTERSEIGKGICNSPLVPATVSGVTVLGVPSTSTPFGVLLLELLAGGSDRRGRSNGSKGEKSNNGGLEHFDECVVALVCRSREWACRYVKLMDIPHFFARPLVYISFHLSSVGSREPKSASAR